MKKFYLIKWLNLPKEESTWEPAEELSKNSEV